MATPRRAKAVARRGEEKTPAKPTKPTNATEAEAVLYRSQSSVAVKRDAKGIRQYEVKAYADTAEEAVDKATEMAAALDKFVDGLIKGKE